VAGSKVAVGYDDSQQTGLFVTAASDISGYSHSTDGGKTGVTLVPAYRPPSEIFYLGDERADDVSQCVATS
jgi:hypothetical protein